MFDIIQSRKKPFLKATPTPAPESYDSHLKFCPVLGPLYPPSFREACLILIAIRGDMGSKSLSMETTNLLDTVSTVPRFYFVWRGPQKCFTFFRMDF